MIGTRKSGLGYKPLKGPILLGCANVDLQRYKIISSLADWIYHAQV